jgi:ATP-dependent Clp protease ATP-binding subunit ClpA
MPGNRLNDLAESEENGDERAFSAGDSRDVRAVETRSEATKSILARAATIAAGRGSGVLTSDDLFAALIAERSCAAMTVLESLGFVPSALEHGLEFVLGRASVSTPPMEIILSARVERMLRFAGDEAARKGSTQVESSHLLMALLRDRRGIAALLLETPGLGLEPVGAALNRAFREKITDEP